MIYKDEFTGYRIELYAGPLDGHVYLAPVPYTQEGEMIATVGSSTIGLSGPENEQVEGWYFIIEVEGRCGRAQFKNNPNFKLQS